MSIIDKARRDARRYTSNQNGFGQPVTFKAPTGQTETIGARFTKITLPNDNPEGTAAVTLQAHVTFSEKLLTDLNYPVRDENGKVHLASHLVTATDSTGTAETYVVRVWHPDETIGIVVCELGEYKAP